MNDRIVHSVPELRRIDVIVQKQRVAMRLGGLFVFERQVGPLLAILLGSGDENEEGVIVPDLADILVLQIFMPDMHSRITALIHSEIHWIEERDRRLVFHSNVPGLLDLVGDAKPLQSSNSPRD
jgi:hypothetical protein